MISKSSIDKAGEILRDASVSGAVDPFELGKAHDQVAAFRATYVTGQRPLTLVDMGLRSMAKTVLGPGILVSQRLKRLPRIVEKLGRPEHATMRLSQMEDIGGCRVIVPTLSELRALESHVVGLWSDGLRGVPADYISHPKVDGYRAVHLIVLRGDRLIEIQLRTAAQHLWASMVERMEDKHRAQLRGGRASAAVADALRGFADAVAHVDAGGRVPEELSVRVPGWTATLKRWW